MLTFYHPMGLPTLKLFSLFMISCISLAFPCFGVSWVGLIIHNLVADVLEPYVHQTYRLSISTARYYWWSEWVWFHAAFSNIPAISWQRTPEIGFTHCTHVGNGSWVLSVMTECFNCYSTQQPRDTVALDTVGNRRQYCSTTSDACLNLDQQYSSCGQYQYLCLIQTTSDWYHEKCLICNNQNETH